MLRLKLASDPRWADLAAKSLEDILTDHAYCEQKAASTCISLIQNYPDRIALVEELSPIVTEEWGHFRMVLAELKKRSLKLGKQRRDDYVLELRKLIRPGDSVERQLMDKLLVSALIEARSCERFRILSENLPQPELKKFYRHFMESEAVHYTVFMKLAKKYMPVKVVNERWREMLETERQIIESMAPRGERIH
jgi:tRNA-(ms[2]io[6]A)-hydroxylase